MIANSEKTFEDLIVRVIESYGLAGPIIVFAFLIGAPFYIGKLIGAQATAKNVDAQTRGINLTFEKEIEQKKREVTEIKKLTGLHLRDAREALNADDAPKLEATFDELTFRISNELLPALGTLCDFAGACLDKKRLSGVAETDVLPALLHLNHLLAMLNNSALEKKLSIRKKFLIREQSVDPLIQFVDNYMDKGNNVRVAELKSFRDNIGRYLRG